MKWISVKERFPAYDIPVLAIINEYPDEIYIMELKHGKNIQDFWQIKSIDTCQKQYYLEFISHWMTLPLPPKPDASHE